VAAGRWWWLTFARPGGRVAPGHRLEGRTMAYSIRCADAGVDCPGSFTTETKEELMKHVELHAKEAHPDLDLQQEQVEALVKISN
jgi:predicted small metal-binding protein